ncbi:MAG: NAD(P)-dependent oxidoreductase [Eubacteriales bacterium]|nr:NAD(P)-dependent oxidoreductase [Eubacteriales bacterium]
MKRALITGGTSMLGAALARELLAQGDEVLALYRAGSPKRRNLPEGARALECDLDGYARVTPQTIALDGKPVGAWDVCYHFAWGGTTGAARDNAPLQERNIRHTLEAMDMAARLGCQRFVGAGSQAEFGRVPTGVRLSAELPAFPFTGYGMAKLAAGRLGGLHARSLGMAFCWVRVISVYGPMDNEGSLTVSTLRRLLAGENAPFTKGEQLWDFLYSEDAARAFRLIGEKGRDGATYVLGSGREVRMADALRTLCHAVRPGLEPQLGALPYRPDQCMYLCADLSALTADTGFVPQVSYEEGVRRTLLWCKENEAL